MWERSLRGNRNRLIFTGMAPGDCYLHVVFWERSTHTARKTRAQLCTWPSSRALTTRLLRCALGLDPCSS